jgi:hypothetical protein
MKSRRALQIGNSKTPRIATGGVSSLISARTAQQPASGVVQQGPPPLEIGAMPQVRGHDVGLTCRDFAS